MKKLYLLDYLSLYKTVRGNGVETEKRTHTSMKTDDITASSGALAHLL
ncbi:hypothetical protein [Alteromonas sp. a30]|nr:hypothetical protein [Alteromonas sp. a30]MCY7297100.1 hypothetical protein [Alteromonas sp. a30]